MVRAQCFAVAPRREPASVATAVRSQVVDRIVAAYEAKGFNRHSFSKACDVSYTTLAAWENGKGGQFPEPSAEALRSVAAALGVSEAYLRGDTSDEASDREVQRESEASYLAWRSSSLAPPDLRPEIERRMLATRFRFPPDQLWRWGTIHDQVVAEIRGRQVASELRAKEEATAEARDEAKSEGATRPKRPLRR